MLLSLIRFVLLVLAISWLAAPAIVRAELAAPAPWCLSWSDTCTSCLRNGVGTDPSCRTRPAPCVPKALRCGRANEPALRAACAQVTRTPHNDCNTCAPMANGKVACTLLVCPRDIACAVPARP